MPGSARVRSAPLGAPPASAVMGCAAWRAQRRRLVALAPGPQEACVGDIGEQPDEAVDEGLVRLAGGQRAVHHGTDHDVPEQLDVDHVGADLAAGDRPLDSLGHQGVQAGGQRRPDGPAHPLGVAGRLGQQRGIRTTGGRVAQQASGLVDARAHVSLQRAPVAGVDGVERRRHGVHRELDLRGPAAVEGGLGHTRPCCHVLHRHPGEPPLREHLARRERDRVLRGLLAGTPGAAAAGGGLGRGHPADHAITGGQGDRGDLALPCCVGHGGGMPTAPCMAAGPLT